MKVLLIDKNLVERTNRGKWDLLARETSMELAGICPDRWIENFQTLHFVPDPEAAFPITPLKVAWPRYYNRAFYTEWFKLITKVRAFSPDVLLWFEEPFSAFAAQAILIHKIACPEAKLAFYTWDNLSKGIDFPGRWPYRLLYRYIARQSYARGDLIICATAEGEHFLEPLVRGLVRKIYFGVTRTQLCQSSQEGRLWEGKFVVGYLGRMLEMKGVDDLLDALALLPDEICAVFVGGGPFAAQLKSRSEKNGMSKRVKVLPGVSSDEARRFICRVDVLVLPSRTVPTWKEQYGRVLVESMESGTPVVGSSSGAIPDVIGDAGLVFPEGDAGALAGILRRLYSDPGLRKSLSERGKLRFAAEFSAETFAKRMYQTLCELTSRGA